MGGGGGQTGSLGTNNNVFFPPQIFTFSPPNMTQFVHEYNCGSSLPLYAGPASSVSVMIITYNNNVDDVGGCGGDFVLITCMCACVRACVRMCV